MASGPRQSPYAVRFDWGRRGVDAIAADADVAVVIDVLSFTTTLTVAVDAGITVFPYDRNDLDAAVYRLRR
jgi:2-phosphosulfolactate phosphatase